MTRLYKIKWENILLLMTIPLAINQFLKADSDFKLLSILMSLTLYGGLALSIRVGRKEALEEIKRGTYEPLIDLSEVKDDLLRVIGFIKDFIGLLKAIKKEVIKRARYINDQAYILRASFK